MSDDIRRRKDEHIAVCLREDVESGRRTGLGSLSLEYDALPDLALSEVDVSTKVLGRELAAPIIVGAMTGGTEEAARLNGRIARAAARCGLGMALGSQRAMLEDPSLTDTYAVREEAPGLPLLIGNIGAVQLNAGVRPSAIEAAAAAVGADAMAFHLNPIHEAVQPGGDTDFRGLTERLAEAVAASSRPCLVKEVGAGISEKTAKKLAAIPFAGVEVAGVGGTSWVRVEGLRASSDSPRARAGDCLAGFGVPTLESLRYCRAAFGDRLVIASGGIRDGHDIAVALALGADAVAVARPVLLAAVESEEAIAAFLETLVFELRVLCFAAGAKDVADLRAVKLVDEAGRVVERGGP